MTDSEIRRLLLSWAASELAHESYEGDTTYHRCPCGRGGCRRERCVSCLGEVVAWLEKVAGGAA